MKLINWIAVVILLWAPSCSYEELLDQPPQGQYVTPRPIPNPFPTYQLTKIFRVNLYLCAVTLFFATLSVAKADVIFLPLSGADSHKFSSPYSGRFQAINGNSFDVSKYYVSSSLELFFSGLVIWEARDNLTLTIPWYFDIGYQSELFHTDPVLQLGLSANFSSQNHSIIFGVNNLLTIGGHIRERACIDRLFREFHCGTGLPWIDKPKPTKNDHKTFFVRYRLVF